MPRVGHGPAAGCRAPGKTCRGMPRVGHGPAADCCASGAACHGMPDARQDLPRISAGGARRPWSALRVGLAGRCVPGTCLRDLFLRCRRCDPGGPGCRVGAGSRGVGHASCRGSDHRARATETAPAPAVPARDARAGELPHRPAPCPLAIGPDRWRREGSPGRPPFPPAPTGAAVMGPASGPAEAGTLRAEVLRTPRRGGLDRARAPRRLASRGGVTRVFEARFRRRRVWWRHAPARVSGAVRCGLPAVIARVVAARRLRRRLRWGRHALAHASAASAGGMRSGGRSSSDGAGPALPFRTGGAGRAPDPRRPDRAIGPRVMACARGARAAAPAPAAAPVAWAPASPRGRPGCPGAAAPDAPPGRGHSRTVMAVVRRAGRVDPSCRGGSEPCASERPADRPCPAKVAAAPAGLRRRRPAGSRAAAPAPPAGRRPRPRTAR